MPHSLHSWEDSLSTRLCQCLMLGRVDEYNPIAKALQPMTLIIPSKNIIATLHQLHPPPSNLVPPPYFDYQPQHIFVLDGILFAQSLNHCSPFIFQWALWDGRLTSLGMLRTKIFILKVFKIILGCYCCCSWKYP